MQVGRHDRTLLRRVRPPRNIAPTILLSGCSHLAMEQMCRGNHTMSLTRAINSMTLQRCVAAGPAFGACIDFVGDEIWRH
jgi:hypothetical protein